MAANVTTTLGFLRVAPRVGVGMGVGLVLLVVLMFLGLGSMFRGWVVGSWVRGFCVVVIGVILMMLGIGLGFLMVLGLLVVIGFLLSLVLRCVLRRGLLGVGVVSGLRSISMRRGVF